MKKLLYALIVLLVSSVKIDAQDKLPDLNALTIDAAMSMVAGTARSMGITVSGGEAPAKK